MGIAKDLFIAAEATSSNATFVGKQIICGVQFCSSPPAVEKRTEGKG